MLCPSCNGTPRKFGKDRNGNQRYQCKPCKQTYTDLPEKPLGAMRLPMEKAVFVLKLLLEGCSVRATCRLSGVSCDTVLALLVHAGEKAKDLMESRLVNVKADDVECDEIWGFVGCKQKTKEGLHPTKDEYGDAWCFIAFEANTKLVLSWHVGKRTPIDTECFMEKLQATVSSNRFQITTDGFKPYPNAIGSVFGNSVDYAQLIKTYGKSEDERRYSPPQITDIEKNVVYGEPNDDRICTSYVERNNLNVRTFVRRMTRLTNGFSKKWENHEAALALFFAYSNFCRRHSTLRCTPAMAAGLTDHQWTIEELLKAE